MSKEYNKVTSYRVFVPRYELSLSCGVQAGTTEEYHKVTSYRVLSHGTNSVSAAEFKLVRPRNTTR